MRTRMQVQYKLRHSDSRVVVVEEQKMIDSLAKQACAPRNGRCAARRATSAACARVRDMCARACVYRVRVRACIHVRARAWRVCICICACVRMVACALCACTLACVIHACRWTKYQTCKRSCSGVGRRPLPASCLVRLTSRRTSARARTRTCVRALTPEPDRKDCSGERLRLEGCAEWQLRSGAGLLVGGVHEALGEGAGG